MAREERLLWGGRPWNDMGQKMFASDYDGTLCRHAGIDAQTLAEIEKFRTQGGLFGVCSGRDPGTLNAELARFGLGWDFLIQMNGARIEVGGRCLREKPLQGYEQSLPLLRERTSFFTVIGAGEAYLSAQGTVREDLCREPWIAQAIRNAYRLVQCPEMLHTVYQISCRTENEQAAVELTRELHALGLSAYPNCEYVDIVPVGVGKAEAVDAVREHFGLPAEAVWTAGDGRNDMEMLSRFSGFAMSHAEDCVKQAAGRTAVSVGQALKQIRHI